MQPFLHTHHLIISNSLELIQEKIVFFPNTPRQGGADHQRSLSCCVAGTMKGTSCQWAIPLTWTSLRCSFLEWRRDHSSLHHSGTLSSFCRYEWTHSPAWFWFTPISLQGLFAFWEEWQPGWGVGEGDGGILRLSVHSVDLAD